MPPDLRARAALAGDGSDYVCSCGRLCPPGDNCVCGRANVAPRAV